MNSLPNSNHVDIAKLAKVFDARTNSYKFLWLKAIFSLLEESEFNTTDFDFSTIVPEMAVFAWYPNQYYKLSFGHSDKLVTHLGKSEIDLSGNVSLPYLKREIRQLVTKGTISHFSRHVPYATLKVWFETELSGIKGDGKRYKLTASLSNEIFDQSKPLYKIGEKNIELHPDWVSYIRTNFTILKDWLDWHWANYLQSKNPAVPNINKKLNFISSRQSLTGLRNIWDDMIASEPVRCIFTGSRLEAGQYSLDHFVPWTYVAHNEPWNISPVQKRPNVNSIKSNNLPDGRYVVDFVESQFQFIQFNKESLSTRKWKNFLAPYTEGLKLNESEILNKESLHENLERLILGQLDNAKRLGFSKDWVYPVSPYSSESLYSHQDARENPS